MFAIELANRLGFVHVDELVAQMTPEEFDERWAYELIEPMGRRNAVIIQAEIMALARLAMQWIAGGKPKGHDVTPDDLMPWFKQEAEELKSKKRREEMIRGRDNLTQVLKKMGFGDGG